MQIDEVLIRCAMRRAGGAQSNLCEMVSHISPQLQGASSFCFYVHQGDRGCLTVPHVLPELKPKDAQTGIVMISLERMAGHMP